MAILFFSKTCCDKDYRIFLSLPANFVFVISASGFIRPISVSKATPQRVNNVITIHVVPVRRKQHQWCLALMEIMTRGDGCSAAEAASLSEAANGLSSGQWSRHLVKRPSASPSLHVAIIWRAACLSQIHFSSQSGRPRCAESAADFSNGYYCCDKTSFKHLSGLDGYRRSGEVCEMKSIDSFDLGDILTDDWFVIV